jgi:hypothetical protein
VAAIRRFGFERHGGGPRVREGAAFLRRPAPDANRPDPCNKVWVSKKISSERWTERKKLLLVYMINTVLMWSAGFTKTVTKNELRSFGTMDLGKLAAEKINSYHQSLDKRDINDLFHLLNEIAKRVIYSNYRGIATHLLDDTIAQVSEDVFDAYLQVSGEIYQSFKLLLLLQVGYYEKSILDSQASLPPYPKYWIFRWSW